MKGIPPEIDALMWQLAETGNPVAQAEFEARHARYGPELTRRIRMVAELRQAGKTVVARPTFTPRTVRVAPASRWAVGATVGLAIVAIAAVAFVAASDKEKPAPQPEVVQKTPQVSLPKQEPEITPVPQPEVTQEKPPVEEPNPEKGFEHLKPRDTRLEDTQLTLAITMIAQDAGLQVTVAPGFQDRRVSLDYRGLNALDTLRAMGEQYGFTVFQESEGHVLVVPARAEADTSRRIGP